jgi:transcriptional regulator GlxA family with amidase domain
MTSPRRPTRVSVLALPESMATPIHGLYETLEILEAVANPGEGDSRLFEVEVVGMEPGVLSGACGLPLKVHRAVSEVEHTDIVLMTSMLFDGEWIPGRHPEIVSWLVKMHGRGTSLCSACAGALLLAETGLLNGLEATTHWAFAPTFRRNFPEVTLRIDELLVTAGTHQELVMSGAASSWQDLILFLIARHYSPAAAQSVGKFLLFPWHADAQTPYVSFSPPRDHGDAAIRAAQAWVHANFKVSNPVDEMVQLSGLSESSFKRRFKRATGLSPLHYVQHVRIEEAKRLLEGTGHPVDEVCWTIGYEDPAFFRRLFRRLTRLSPGQYRKKFRIPAYARAGD